MSSIVKLDGVSQGTDTNGSLFFDVFEDARATGNAHTISLEEGGIIDFATRRHLPSHASSTNYITVEFEDIDSLLDEDEQVTFEGALDILPLFTISDANAGPIFAADMANKYVRWKGIRFFKTGSYWNQYIQTYASTYDAFTYTRAMQADNWEFIQCLFGPGPDAEDEMLGNPGIIRWEGKRILIKDCDCRGIHGSSSGDGLFVAYYVGEGPVIRQNSTIELCGENSGGGAHGYTGSAYSPPTPYSDWWENEVQSIVGDTITGCNIGRPDHWQADSPAPYKNLDEFTYGTDILRRGNHYYNAYIGGQQYMFVHKLSTFSNPDLNFLATKDIEISYNTCRNLCSFYLNSEYTANPENPPFENILIEHNEVFNLDDVIYGINPYGSVDSRVLFLNDQPQTFVFRNNLIHATSIRQFLEIGNGVGGHPDLPKMLNFVFENNIIILPDNMVADVTGLEGTGVYNMRGWTGSDWILGYQRGFLDGNCTTPVFRNNIYVSNSLNGTDSHDSFFQLGDVTSWNGGYPVTPSEDLTATNWIFRGAGGRNTVLALLRNPTAAEDADKDYRFTEEVLDAEIYVDNLGNPIGPDWVQMKEYQGSKWMHSWDPSVEPEPPTSFILKQKACIF